MANASTGRPSLEMSKGIAIQFLLFGATACLGRQATTYFGLHGGGGGGGGADGCKGYSLALPGLRGSLWAVSKVESSACAPRLPRFILLGSFSDTLLVVLILDIVNDCHL